MSQGKPSDAIMLERTRWLAQVRRGKLLSRRAIRGHAEVVKATREFVLLKNVNRTGHGSSGKIRRSSWQVIYHQWRLATDEEVARMSEKGEVKSEEGRAA